MTRIKLPVWLSKVTTCNRLRFTFAMPNIPKSCILLKRLPSEDFLVKKIKTLPTLKKIYQSKNADDPLHYKKSNVNDVANQIYTVLSEYFLRMCPVYNMILVSRVIEGASSLKNPAGNWIDEVSTFTHFNLFNFLSLFLIFVLV